MSQFDWTLPLVQNPYNVMTPEAYLLEAPHTPEIVENTPLEVDVIDVEAWLEVFAEDLIRFDLCR